MRWFELVGWLALCFGVAGLGGKWTAGEIPRWYRALRKPAIAPPNWVFGPAWTLLYAMMAIAAWRVGEADASAARTWALVLFLIQLTFNLAWSWIFFHRHAIGAALAEIALLWVAIGATTMVFSRVSPLAAGFMAPYWAWVTFAAILNWAFWRLNQTGKSATKAGASR